MAKAISGHSAPKSGMAMTIVATPGRRPCALYMYSTIDNDYFSTDFVSLGGTSAI